MTLPMSFLQQNVLDLLLVVQEIRKTTARHLRPAATTMLETLPPCSISEREPTNKSISVGHSHFQRDDDDDDDVPRNE